MNANLELSWIIWGGVSILLFFGVIVPFLQGLFGKGFICSSCGYKGYPKKSIKYGGSAAMEIFLWLVTLLFFVVFFPFGIILLLVSIVYSFSRISNKTKTSICPKCKNSTMIPCDSPIGKKIEKELQ
ncbi:MAG: hypothetical protein QG567_1482 [Campylobacterota bacterium]|nr:hypothetical protein [Campylobacterota bacterium]